MKETFEKALTEAFIVALYSDTNPVQKKQGEWLGNCVFHNDKNPSFGFKTEPLKDLGVYNCFSCAAQGNIYTYAREHLKETKPLIYLNEQLKVPIPADNEFTKRFLKFKEKCENIDTNLKIPDKLILEKKKLLFGQFTKKLKVLNDMGITDQVIKDYNLGFDGQRFWIPIKDKDGIFRNVRKYDPNSKIKVISFSKGYGDRRLWPIENLNSSTIYIMEGEKDTLIALSNGLNAVTSTSGGSNWNTDWGELFKDKKVIICMDIDHSGLLGAQKRAANIKKFANEIKIIEFPLDIEEYPRGDFADYIEKFSIQDFELLVTETKTLYLKTDKDNSELNLNFSEASDTAYRGKKCIIKGVRCYGGEQSIKGLPRKVIAECTGTRKDKKCSSCILKPDSFVLNYEFQKDDPLLLGFSRINDDDWTVKLRECLKITRKCTENKLDVTEEFNLQILNLKAEKGLHEVSHDDNSDRRLGFYIFKGRRKLKTNNNYTIKCVTIRDKKNQDIVHQIYDAEEGNTGIDNFDLNSDMKNKLSCFKVDYENGQTFKDKCNEIYSEFSNLSYIYGREDVFHIMDLAYLSVLNYQIDGREIEKGWSESLILGDSSTGKTQTAKFLMNHYQCGELVSAESATLSGLLASVTHSSGTGWILQWGALPLNDKRLVVVEETSGLKVEHIALLTQVRSGSAIVKKVVDDKIDSRTRIIWISNARVNDIPVDHKLYPVTLIKELFGNLEDIRRLDNAIILSNSDIPLQQRQKKSVNFIPKYSSQLCHNLVMFAWSRKVGDIYISNEIDKYIFKKSIELVNTYSEAIPLIESGDIQQQVTRASISNAVRVFSLNKDDKLVVQKDHVDGYIDLINRVYGSRVFGYKRFSNNEKINNNLVNIEEVCDLLNLQDKHNVNELSSYSRMSPEHMKSFLEGDANMAQSVSIKLKDLKRNNAIRQGTGNYYDFRSGFIRLLIELKDWYDDGGDFDSYFKKNINKGQKEEVNLD